ncbi:Fic family protein [Mycobacterium stomatepiae]|uniref:Fic family protein n=1 Tax=Mycobacterium stomatepiae TaxID=470076 RepID=A0A7I7QAR9_9MYCO|nr:Fic family protein [Mycobacterium stomatepiae]BBY23157.1 Fic family protein [Mycobacterium stomatepiae]
MQARDAWPSHGAERRPWTQTQRGGTREDRTLHSVTVSLPPYIAKIDATIDADIAVELEAAMSEISRLDSTHGTDLEALSTLLLRTESVASSKIERVEASLDDYARALHGGRGNSSAVSMVAATTALNEMIASVDQDAPVQISAILRAHEALMREDPTEAQHAGQIRTVQNWIGGSDYSPRDALYVPPPPDTVPAYLDDLMEFANRTDIPVLIQAAIAHAQFESIHPFTDGNGRIGRALINTIFRRRGATTRLVVPLASALVAHRERYFGALNTYRAGDVRPLVVTFANSSRAAAAESRTTAQRLVEIPVEWRNMVGSIRRHSATEKLLLLLPSTPIISSDHVASLLDAPRSSVFAAIKRLHDAGVLRPLTDRKRDQVWGASLVLDELDDLGRRIERAST